jgi:hypothetical protein
MSAKFDTIAQIQSYLSTVADPKKEIKRQLKAVEDRIFEAVAEESRWYLAMASILSPSAISPKNGSVKRLIEHLALLPEEQVVNFLNHLPSHSVMEKVLAMYNERIGLPNGNCSPSALN